MNTVNNNIVKMTNIGVRLKEERNRLGLSQDEFAVLGGVKKSAQVNYEAERRHPNTKYLANIWIGGADIQYILTGVHEISPDGQTDLNRATEPERISRWYRAYNRAIKAAMALDIIWGKVIYEIAEEIAEHPEIQDVQIGAKLEVRRKFIQENIEGKDQKGDK